MKITSNSNNPQSSAASMNPIDIQELILKELQDLRSERQELSSRLNALDALQELKHNLAGYEVDRPHLKIGFSGHTNTLYDIYKIHTMILDLNENVQSIEQRINAIEEGKREANGNITAKRIEKIKKILKSNGGSRAFAQLQRDLGISPSQFSRLVKCLDRGCFEVAKRPGAKRGEKMLILK